MPMRMLLGKYTELEHLLIEVALELCTQAFLFGIGSTQGMELRIWSVEEVQ